MRRSIIAAVLFVCVPAALMSEERVQVRGYYQEDGTFVRQRVVDPIAARAETPPSLSRDPEERRREIRRFYEGRVVTSKISFPACRGGVVYDADQPGRTNVDLFNRVNKYGVAVEKGGKAVITKLLIKDGEVDVELNGGGYGHGGDVAWRVLTGVLTVGLAELRDYSQQRYRRGSRLRIVMGNRGTSRLSVGEVDADGFRAALKNDTPANKLLLERAGAGDPESLTEAGLAKGLDALLAMKDLHEKVGTEGLKLSKKTAALLKKAKTKKGLSPSEARGLNQDLLTALYPREYGRGRKGFADSRMDFQRINGYLSVALEL